MKIMKIENSEAHTWDIEVPDGNEYLLSNGIVSHNTSGMIVNATEGIEPVKNMFQMKEGTYTLPQIVPNIKENRRYYENAFDIPNTRINLLASIRQKFLDQGQSVSHYYKTTDSAFDVITDIIHAETVGMKSIYYLTPMKSGDSNESCESCSS